MYYVYMLRCEDNTIYTGYTSDIDRRMEEHFSMGEKGAKYTHKHVPKKLEVYWEIDDKKLAMKLEYHIKNDLNKKQKENLILGNLSLDNLFNLKFDCDGFKRMI